jgi:hypothetical protein
MMNRINRRQFLIVFVGLTITGVFILSILRSKLYELRELITRLTSPRLDRGSPVGVLSQQEMRTIIALSETLMPRIEGSEVYNGLIKDRVNYRTNNVRGYLKEYRNAVKLLEETSKKVIGGKKFSELNLSERDRVVGSILWRYSSEEALKRRLERIFIFRRKIAFRDFVVRDILVTLFQKSSVGWAIVGYSHYPGVPAADPRDYTRALEPSVK